MPESEFFISIKEEVESALRQNPNYFNNFHGLLPNGFSRSNSIYLNNIKPGWLDTSHLELEICAGSTKEELLEVGYTELYLSQSDKDFFETIDNVIKELETEDSVLIYCKLREIGYSHWDLVQ